MEKTFTVKPVGVKYICDSCKNGEMLPTENIKMFEKHIEFTHKCKKCGSEKDFTEKYPLIRYEQL